MIVMLDFAYVVYMLWKIGSTPVFILLKGKGKVVTVLFFF